MKSLQEQLLKKGLIDTDKARKVVGDKRKQARSERKSAGKSAAGNPGSTPPASRVMSSAMSERNGLRDTELNRIKQQEVEQKAVAAQIRQLIKNNRIDRGDPDLPFNFICGKVVQKLTVCSAIHTQLKLGHLNIVALVEGGTSRFELVPKAVAAKIAERDPALVVATGNQNPEGSVQDTDEEDPYADFIVPDDLMW